MDRRQQKTRASIFRAFSALLKRKSFNHITVQEIIDEANIGRSTFYAHFETKDELLKAMCTDIFQHVFSHELTREQSHDFSSEDGGLEAKLTHLLYHLHERKNELLSILSCESSELFMTYFKDYLSEMFPHYLSGETAHVPQAFLVNHLAGSFAEAVRWWMAGGMVETPEEIAGYFMSVTRL